MTRLLKIAVAMALILSALSFLTTAYLYSRLHDLSVQGCARQNELRRELNRALVDFGQTPRFRVVDCERAWRLYGPEPPPQPYRHGH